VIQSQAIHFHPLSMDQTTSALMAERFLGVFQPFVITPEAFKEAYELPIGEHVEKNYKGLSYLSWPFAFRYLKENFPTLFVAFEENTNGWPVFGQEGCWLLRPYLTDGIKRTPALVFPIMDNKHNAVKTLDARQVSDNIQRASVKCIATFTGLGLKLYSGEDIPRSDDEKAAPTLPMQQDAPKAAAAAKPAAPFQREATGTSNAEAFDGKAALLAFGEADPLGYADRLTSMKAVKAGLEAIGLAKGEDVKDKEMFANVVTTMVTSWVKERGVKVTKAAMGKEIDALRYICAEGSTDQAIQGVKVFVEGKQ